MKSLRLMIRLSQPYFLIGAALLYALGVGIAHYLGVIIRWDVYLLGQAWVTLLQLSTYCLNEYFDIPVGVEPPNRIPVVGNSGALGTGKLPRPVAFWIGAACLAVVASLTVLFTRSMRVNPGLYIVMGAIFVGAFLYSVPPVRLSCSGYGELTVSIILANLVPALAFLLQAGELHRLLAMATFPLTTLLLAMMLALELPNYAVDLKYDKRNLMMRIGWQRGMLLHNYLLLGGFFLLGLALVFGLPVHIALPAFFTLPIAIFQVWMINRIADGAKPNWNLLMLAAAASFGLTAYLLTYSFWTH
jgi:1,4-dihydroxy-2-naphthoate octaprenyltransferase